MLFHLPEYNNIKTYTLAIGETIEMKSHNYPRNTYADSRWSLNSRNTSSFILTFLDFDITFGVSLTIGVGSNFSHDTALIKFGSRDIAINVDDMLLLKESSVWILFQTNDRQAGALEQTQINFLGDDSINADSFPSISGVKLRIESVAKGILNATTSPLSILST